TLALSQGIGEVSIRNACGRSIQPGGPRKVSGRNDESGVSQATREFCSLLRNHNGANDWKDREPGEEDSQLYSESRAKSRIGRARTWFERARRRRIRGLETGRRQV